MTLNSHSKVLHNNRLECFPAKAFEIEINPSRHGNTLSCLSINGYELQKVTKSKFMNATCVIRATTSLLMSVL